MSGTISFPGMSGDQNYGEIIEALVSSRRIRRMEPLDRWKLDWETKIETIGELDSSLSSLYTAVRGMSRVSQFMVRSVRTSDETVLSASASGTATTGSYRVQVAEAIKHRLGSDGKADFDTTVYGTAGSHIDITIGGVTDTITLGIECTLEDIADEVNTQSAAQNGLVEASVVYDGSSSNPYRLVLTSTSGGSDNEITIDANTTSVDFQMTGAGDQVDTVEEITWNGTSAAVSSGSYTGTTNKTFTFTITSAGDNQSVGTDDITVHWKDSEGNEGTVAFDSTYTPGTAKEVFQGVEISLEAGDVTNSDTFRVDVWHPDLQAAQDEGIAKAAKYIHSGFSDSSTTAVTTTEQTFSYTYNGQEQTLTIPADTTLSQLKNLINFDSGNTGVTASIMDDGSGLSTAFHLVLSGNQTGAAYRITDVTHSLDNLGGSFTETQSAGNAMVKVDNYPSGDVYIQKSTNQVSGVIDGVTLNLNDTGAATVTIGTDNDSLVEKAQAFCEAFNEVRTAIIESTSYDEGTGSAGTMLGNYAFQIVKTRLDAIVTGSAPGFSSDDDNFTALNQLGFSTDAQTGSETEGLLILDTSRFVEALNEDADGVAELFSAYLSGTSDNTNIAFSSALYTATPGTYDVEVDTDHEDPPGTPAPRGRFRLQGQTDWGDWVNLSGSSGSYYLTGITAPERGIELRVTCIEGSGTHTAALRLKGGVMTQLSSEMETMLSSSGPLKTLENNYYDIISNIDNRIEQEQRRLDAYEDALSARFARLDAYIGQMTQMSSGFAAIAGSLGG
jgi:flagellar hook-associated protein 2